MKKGKNYLKQENHCASSLVLVYNNEVKDGRQFMLNLLTKYLERSLYESIIWAYGFHGHLLRNKNALNNEHVIQNRQKNQREGKCNCDNE